MNILKKLKKNKVASAGIGYTVGNYLLKGINFLTIPIFTRLMTTEHYGIYSTYMTYDAIISVFIAFALHSSLKNAKYKYNEKFDDYVSSILILPVMFLAVLLVGVNVFCQPMSRLLELNRGILNVLFIHAFANSIVTIYNGKLGLDYKYQDFLKISFVNTVSNLVLSLALMFTLYANERYMGRILGSALPLVVIAVVIYWKSFQKAKPRFNKEYWKFGLNYSLPIIPHGISQIILSSFDRIMIKNLVGTSEAGIYSLGCNIEQLVKITTTSLDTVWGPWFYERMNENDHESIKKCSTWYAYGMFVFLSCLIFGAPEIVKIMGSEAYQDAKYVVIPLLACTFFTFLYTLPATVEYYYQKTKMIALGTMGAALLNIVLNYFCIKAFGYQAAAYTTLTAYVAYFVFHYLIAKKIAGVQLFHTAALCKYIAGIFVVSAVALALIEFFVLRWAIMLVFFAVNGWIFYKKIFPQLKR
jgi:O-antigen/teichoic acid export membrane protein